MNSPDRTGRRPRTFTPLYDDILFESGLSLHASVLLCYLSRRGGKQGRAFPSIADMQRVLHSSRNTVKAALRELEDRQFIHVARRVDTRGQHSNLYFITYTPGQNLTTPRSKSAPIRDTSEETSESRDYERLATQAPPARPLSLSPIAQALFTHHQLLHPDTPPPSTRIAADMMMAAHRNGMDERQAVEEFTVFATYRIAGLKDKHLPESYRWWVTAWTNHLTGTRTALGNFRPELTEPTVPMEYDGKMAQIMEDIYGIN